MIYDSNKSAVTDSSLMFGLFVKAPKSREYWNEVETDENGSFSISVLPGENMVGRSFPRNFEGWFLGFLVEKTIFLLVM